jgi:DNA-binding LytR/AlgR family response regulator
MSENITSVDSFKVKAVGFMKEPFQCEECGKHCEELFALTAYNNQTPTGDLCEDCFIVYSGDKLREFFNASSNNQANQEG